MRARRRLASLGIAIAALTAFAAPAAHAAPGGNNDPSSAANAIAYTEVTPINGPIKAVHTKPGVTPNVGVTVACTDAGERHTAYNAVGMALMWYQIDVHWCWDRTLTITSWSRYYSEDTPGLCWAYTGESAEGRWYGPGYGSGDVTRSGYFKCGVGSLAMSRSLEVGLHVTGGGGYYFE